MKSSENGVERLLDVQAVAALLGVPVSWVYVATANRELPCFRIGRYVRFRASEIEDYIQGQRRGELK